MIIDGSDLPPNCTYSENNWKVLASFWHPISFSEEVKDTPFGTKLLDQELVVYRTRKGITVANSRCPHRGASLTLGILKDDQLICAYHGLHYNHSGACTNIPSNDRDTKVPISPRMCLTTYPVVERYGLVWTCLAGGEARPALPDWQVLEELNVQKAAHLEFSINTSAGRYTENFNDVAHFPWVHGDSFGTSREEMGETKEAAYELKETTPQAIYGVVESEGQLQVKPDAPPSDCTSEYIVTFPFASYLKMHFHGTGTQHYFLVMRPTSSKRTRGFLMLTRDYDTADPFEEFVEFQRKVNVEDCRIVETQYPVELPLDPSIEINTTADVFSAAYRRGLRKLGLQ